MRISLNLLQMLKMKFNEEAITKEKILEYLKYIDNNEELFMMCKKKS